MIDLLHPRSTYFPDSLKPVDYHNTDKYWAHYWLEAKRANNFELAGIDPSVTDTVWRQMVGECVFSEKTKIIELASGYGSVCRALLRSLDENTIYNLKLTAVDLSDDVLTALQRQYPQINTLCMNLRQSLPDMDSYDWIVSQFGIEYAGKPVILKLLNSLPKASKLACIVHRKDSVICEESKKIIDTVEKLLNSELLGTSDNPIADLLTNNNRAIDLMKTSIYEKLSHLSAFIHKLPPGFLNGYGAWVINSLENLLRNHQRIQITEFEQWLTDTRSQLDATARRSISMLDASLSDPDFVDIQEQSSMLGFKTTMNKPFAYTDDKGSKVILGQLLLIENNT